MIRLKDPTEGLSTDALITLQALEGHLIAGRYDDAMAETVRIPPEEFSTEAVLLVRIRVMLYQRQWEQADALSHLAIRKYPDNEEIIALRAFILNHNDRPREAAGVLLQAPPSYRASGLIYFNFGCIEARFGEIEKAVGCISVAVELNRDLRNFLMTDPDIALILELNPEETFNTPPADA